MSAAKRALASRMTNPKLLDAFKAAGMTVKISTKGGVSVYGINRFPVTLYKSQWRKLLKFAPVILAFIELFDSRLPDNPNKK